VLDLSFLIDHVMMDIKPLHWGDVIASDVPLKVREPLFITVFFRLCMHMPSPVVKEGKGRLAGYGTTGLDGDNNAAAPNTLQWGLQHRTNTVGCPPYP
jgi:hypothetical protein